MAKCIHKKVTTPCCFEHGSTMENFAMLIFFDYFFAEPFYVRIRITPIKLINISMFSWKLFFMWVGEDIERNMEMKTENYNTATHKKSILNYFTIQYLILSSRVLLIFYNLFVVQRSRIPIIFLNTNSIGFFLYKPRISYNYCV